MGQASSTAGTPQELQGLSERDKSAIREAWQVFCDSHPDPGALLFSALLDKHPEYQALFRDFREVPRNGVVNVPFFKTHCSAMVKLLSDVVESLDKPALFADVVRTNALEHATRDVLPRHFESLWQVVETRVGLSARGTPSAAASWEKLLEVRRAMQEITRNVYENLGITASVATVSSGSGADESGGTREAPRDQSEGAKTSKADSPKASVRKTGSSKLTTPVASSPKQPSTSKISSKPSTPMASSPKRPSTPKGSPKQGAPMVSSPKSSTPKVSDPKASSPEPSSSELSSPTNSIVNVSGGTVPESSASDGKWDRVNPTYDKRNDRRYEPNGSEPKRTGPKSKENQ